MKALRLPQANGADALWWQMQAVGILTDWEREFRFHATRLWRFDLAIPHLKLAVEVDGYGPKGSMGAHQRIAGIRGGCEKYCEAAILGWRVMRVTTDQVKGGQALQWIERALAMEGK